MKKIALITDGWRRYVTYAWVAGIMQGAEKLGVDIHLYTYNTNGNLSHDDKFNAGEYALFDQIDYDAFDGFIFDCTNTENPDIIAIYKEYYGEPCGHLSHEQLHTTYFDRSKKIEAE